MNALGQPPMLECLVKLQPRGLRPHSSFQSVRRSDPPADEAVNLFLDVDERLFHGGFGIGWKTRRSKQLLNRNILSFTDKYYLTYVLFWSIHCAMIANEISPMANARLMQIQNRSRIFKRTFLTAAIVFGIFGIISVMAMMSLGKGHPDVLQILLPGLKYVGWAVTSWFAYRLFSAYAGGDLFALAVVQRIRWLGICIVLVGIGNGVIALLMTLLATYQAAVPLALSLMVPPMVICLQVFFNLVPGLAIIFIAKVMDEGRKLQEEQELTV